MSLSQYLLHSLLRLSPFTTGPIKFPQALMQGGYMDEVVHWGTWPLADSRRSTRFVGSFSMVVEKRRQFGLIFLSDSLQRFSSKRTPPVGGDTLAPSLESTVYCFCDREAKLSNILTYGLI